MCRSIVIIVSFIYSEEGWHTSVELPIGIHPYQFIVDGERRADPLNTKVNYVLHVSYFVLSLVAR